MGSGLFGIGISGLNAANAGLVTTGHNISNATTPGYHRQQTSQASAIPQFTGAGFIGTGVTVDSIKRVYSDYLESQLTRAQAQSSYFKTYSDQIAQIDNILADPNAGLAPELEAFFSAVHDVAAHPANVPSRQAMLSAGNSLSARFQALDNRFVEINRGVNSQIESTISNVNAYTHQIADLNRRIAGARADPNQPPNDLLDKRDDLVSKLNELIGASAVVQNDGMVSVTVGNGQSLVVGTRSFDLQAVNSLEVPEQTDVAYVSGGTPVIMTPQTLTGGTLGALLAFRGEALTDARNQLGRIAAGLSEAFNAQHRLGQDLSGAMGGDFFVVPQGTVKSNNVNTGNGVFTATIVSASALTASDYRLSYTGAAYQLTRISDNTTTSYATMPQTVDGMTLQLSSGVPQNGDTWYIEPTRYTAGNINVAITQPNSIAAAAPMRTSTSAANTGTGTINAGVVNAPANANLQQPVTITFTSATTFNVTGTGTGNPVGVAYTANGNITYNGWTVQIAGTPRTGDTFTIGPNTNGTADNRNVAKLADLQVANILNSGTTSFQAGYGQLTALVGNRAKDASIGADAQEAIAAQARATQQSLSGVNLDEEAANLMRYQQAYQASGKVIQVATTIFDTILGIRS